MKVVDLSPDHPQHDLLREIEAKGFFLRDDYDIRIRNPDLFDTAEAYSLFRQDPYGREGVFAGSLEWAIKQAHEQVMHELPK